jgi:hypothetical protein
MKEPKKKRLPKDDTMDDGRHVTINDLAGFTNSEVVEELKLGFSQHGPIDDEPHDDGPY